MKKECEIVQDLLFGYQDGTLHEASKELVEKHLNTCEECKKILGDMNEENVENKDEQEIDYLKKVKKKMSKKNKWIIIIGTILGIIILFNIGIFIYYYYEVGKVEIYLNDDITEEQMESIKNSVTNIDENAVIEYYSKEDSLNQMKEKFGDNKDLLAGYVEDNNPLNAYYVAYTSVENAGKIEAMLISSQLEGIKNITCNSDLNPYLFAFSKILMDVNGN